MIAAATAEEAAELREGLRALDIALAEDRIAALLRYLDLLYVWNRMAGLTTIPRKDGVRLHLLDSLAVLRAIDRGPCLDLGTGAGLPGMVLAIADPESRLVLVESNRRRCSFLLEVVRLLALGNVRVVESDVESLDRGVRYPLVLSRAFRPPVEFASIASGLVAPGGRIVLMLADPDASEVEEIRRASGMSMAKAHRFGLPGGREKRTVLVLEDGEAGSGMFHGKQP